MPLVSIPFPACGCHSIEIVSGDKLLRNNGNEAIPTTSEHKHHSNLLKAQKFHYICLCVREKNTILIGRVSVISNSTMSRINERYFTLCWIQVPMKWKRENWFARKFARHQVHAMNNKWYRMQSIRLLYGEYSHFWNYYDAWKTAQSTQCLRQRHKF